LLIRKGIEMSTILLVVHLLVAIFLVAFILLQRSGGGALDGLGGGSGNGFMTARGTGNFLTRATAILATLFFITSLSLSLYYKGHSEARAQSLLETAPAEQQVPSAPAVPVAPVAEK